MSNSTPPAVRQAKGGGWQVSLVEFCQWRNCSSERDARYIANAMQLVAAVKRGDLNGEDTARELDEAAAVTVRNLGESWAPNLMRYYAARARLQN